MKYFGYYDTVAERRLMSPAAVNKMNYICSVLKRLGYKVEIISASYTLGTKFSPSQKEVIEPEIFVKYFPTFPRGNILKKIWSVLTINFFLLLEILFHVKRNETVIVYHSLLYMNVIGLAKKIKKFKMILEVEEIYSDVIGNEKKRKREIEYIKTAEAYIFPTTLLNDLLNKANKPYCLIHGTYHVEENKNLSFDDDKIHCIYSGTLDSRKGGAMAAVESAKYLDSRYHIHILGFGSESEKQDLLQLIDKIKSKTSCEISFDGLVTGKQYIEFIQKCQIGLSTQDPKANFNNTSFPSKILTYLSNGLRVVSVKIPVVEKSDVSSLLFFYDEQTPEAIAKRIKGNNVLELYDSRKCIEKLDEVFTKELNELIHKL